MGGPKKRRDEKRPERASSSAWRDEADALREILLGCGLTEAIKWGSRCYAFDGKNVAIVQKMKAFVALMFFKGALLKDPEGVLARPGLNSRVGRRFELTSVDDILAHRAVIQRYVGEAIEIEKAGLKVPRSSKLVLCDELRARFTREPAFRAAFEALTPGRQRGYNIYFSAPKGTAARERRIDKFAARILAGKGMRD